MAQLDHRLPEHRREAFLRFYQFHLTYKSHPGCVYALLPAIAEHYEMDADQRAWLVWLNGNTQNVVTSLLLLEAAPHPSAWLHAVEFWNDHFKLLEWDTDRRHQKSKFGTATEQWAASYDATAPLDWMMVGSHGWSDTWRYAFGQPYMGRLSSWSMIEYARILLPGVPDAGGWMLEDKAGSKSHRNGVATVAGYDAVYWEEGDADLLGLVPSLTAYADGLLAESRSRWGHPDASRLTMESALCTWKSWHKPNRRYPNVYADMMYNRIRKAEARFGHRFELLWEARREHLPEHLRLEDNPFDPGLSPAKQNHYRETGEIILMHHDWPELAPSSFDEKVAAHAFGPRKDTFA